MAAKPGEPLRWLREVAAKHEGPACLTWPFAKFGNGYAEVRWMGRDTSAGYALCEMLHGPAEGREAAHSCGKGHEACVSGAHLGWKTRSENHKDKVAHGTHARGTRNPVNKLAPTEVLEIRDAAGPQHAIAARFGVCQMTVSKIKRKVMWGWLT